MPDELNPVIPPAAEAATPVVPAVESQQVEPPKVSPRIEKLTKLGFENLETEDQAFDRLASAYEQQRTIAEQVKQALAELKQAPQPEPQQTQASGAGWWNPPAADEATIANYRTADGWKEGTPAEVRQQGEALQAYRERFARDLVAKPKEALMPLLKEAFGEFFQQQYGQITAAQQEQQFFTRVDAEHGEWLWQKDPHSGRQTRQLTEEGTRFHEQMVELQESGLPRTKAFEVALKIRNAERAATAKPTPQQVAATNEQTKQDFLRRQVPGPNRNGSLPASGTTPPRNRNLSFGQLAEQQFQLRTGA